MEMRRPAAALVLGLVVLVLALPADGTAAPAPSPGSSVPYYLNFTNISYRASTDGFPLSYDEWLPTHFNSSATYPMVVFLHGIGNSTVRVPGGTNIWQSQLNLSSIDGVTERGIIQNATRDGFILIVLNTRTSAGFFANTPCGGPQLQDVLDAVAHEKALRHVGELYLMGFSMGTMGALEIAGHDLLNVTGLALAAPGPDLFEEYAYENRSLGFAPPSNPATEIVHDECGSFPGSSARATAFLSWMSVARFDPQNFSNISVWVSAGGRDTSIPDNPRIWPYLQMNNSWMTSTCLVNATYGEPANCTTTFQALHRAQPTEYLWRSVFEMQAIHSMGQFDPADIFAWWMGLVGGGEHHSSFPPTVVSFGP
jgi:pimeloyl-ACP methyl ester carboxylesterase